MKKVIVTLASGPHQAYLDMTRSRLIEYGKKHSYDVRFFNEVLTTDRPPAWSKILIIQKMLETYEIVLWIDSDAVILDPSTDIFDEFEVEKTELALVEHCYGGEAHANTGVMLIKRTENILQFLDLVWDQVDLIDHPWWEQAAILRCLGIDSKVWPIGKGEIVSRVAIDVKFLDKKWNAIRQDFPHENVKIRHFAGEAHSTRKFLISSLTLDNEASQAEFQKGINQTDSLIAERDNVVAERDNVVAERDKVVAERDKVVAERDKVVAELEAIKFSHEKISIKNIDLNLQLSSQGDHIASQEWEIGQLLAERNLLRKQLNELRKSLSWKVTKPLRQVAKLIRFR
jgi:hypothetical protein